MPIWWHTAPRKWVSHGDDGNAPKNESMAAFSHPDDDLAQKSRRQKVTKAPPNAKRVTRKTASDRDMRLPSEVEDEFWITASSDGYTADQHEPEIESGKWLVFGQRPFVNETWSKIRDAVYDGTLSFAAKVATAKPNPNGNGRAHVICVYTHDGGRHASLVRERLRTLGFDRKLSWKADEQTFAGEYANRGFTRISKRYE